MEFEDRLEPEVAALFPAFSAMDLDDIAGAREEITRRLADAPTRHAESVTRSDRWIPGAEGDPDVLVRVYRPVAALDSLPCLVWIHGGGFVMGTIDRDDEMLEHLVTVVGCMAVSIEWRQAPEHPFPASHDDCYAGLKWVCAHADQLGADPTRIALGGASSGGGSAVGVALRARDEGTIDLSYLLLVFPMLDDRNVTASSRLITDPRVWNRKSNRLAWDAYLGALAGSDEVPAYAAPARAVDVSDLPPTFVAVGDLDLFLDEDLEFAARLAASGVPLELHVYPGAIHGFYSFAPTSRNATAFAQHRDAALVKAFAPDKVLAG